MLLFYFFGAERGNHVPGGGPGISPWAGQIPPARGQIMAEAAEGSRGPSEGLLRADQGRGNRGQQRAKKTINN